MTQNKTPHVNISYRGGEYVAHCPKCKWTVSDSNITSIREEAAQHVCDAPELVPEKLAFVSGAYGGPTEENPKRRYCKDDQTCCDFVCGN